LTILPLRGNVNTRVQKALEREYDAIVLAEAGLTRLGLQAHIRELFSLETMLPAPGQGALAVQCRADDIETLELLTLTHDPLTAAAVAAERAFLSGLGGGCSLPVGAFAEKENGTIILTGAVISLDGKQSIRLSAADSDPQRLGERLADLVLERGAAELLKASV
jgi:hydroxymethylbilane synthase